MKNASRTFVRTSPPGKRRPGSVMLLLSATFVMGLSGCGFKSALVVQPDRPELKPPPPELMEEAKPNLRQRLRQLSGESPETGTPTPDD